MARVAGGSDKRWPTSTELLELVDRIDAILLATHYYSSFSLHEARMKLEEAAKSALLHEARNRRPPVEL